MQIVGPGVKYGSLRGWVYAREMIRRFGLHEVLVWVFRVEKKEERKREKWRIKSEKREGGRENKKTKADGGWFDLEVAEGGRTPIVANIIIEANTFLT